jgi:hypothetical protein
MRCCRRWPTPSTGMVTSRSMCRALFSSIPGSSAPSLQAPAFLPWDRSRTTAATASTGLDGP